MKRVFEFDGDKEQDRTRFKYIVGAATVGTLQENGQRGGVGSMETLRSRARLKHALASVATNDSATDQAKSQLSRVLKPGPQTFALEQPEVEMLKEFFPKVPWSLAESEDAADTFDWVTSRPEAAKE